MERKRVKTDGQTKNKKIFSRELKMVLRPSTISRVPNTILSERQILIIQPNLTKHNWSPALLFNDNSALEIWSSDQAFLKSFKQCSLLEIIFLISPSLFSLWWIILVSHPSPKQPPPLRRFKGVIVLLTCGNLRNFEKVKSWGKKKRKYPALGFETFTVIGEKRIALN